MAHRRPMGVKNSLIRVVVLLVVCLSGTGCETAVPVQESFDHLPPHQQYARALEQAGLDGTALGQSWLAASQGAFQEATAITLPFEEVGYLDPANPSAVAYRFELKRGQRLLVEVSPPTDSGQFFVDLYDATREATTPPRYLGNAEDGQHLDFRSFRNRTFLLRLQPELLRGGRYTVTIKAAASFFFPVSGRGTNDIGSVFGDPRDGGRRRHHGVDIFAPRGTPVIAVADGHVSRVRTGGLGGKTVWLRDQYGHSVYYAHLDEQLVRTGDRVQVGDTLGLVGNTGNARTTPPHLHFGIYNRGPVDPFPYINEPRQRPARLLAAIDNLGQWARVRTEAAPLHTAPGTQTDVVRELAQHTALRLLGGSGEWYRVRLPDGTSGYLAARSAELMAQPVRQTEMVAGTSLFYLPTRRSVTIDSLVAQEPVAVLGTFDDYLFIETTRGRTGWIAAETD